nr:NAD(P)H-binding protein [Sphingomonas jinjuensis]
MAITGATGFVGSRLLDRAVSSGHAVRALARRAQPARPGVSWVNGALGDDAALARLVEGADAVIHVAGVVNVPTRDDFARGNIDGTRAILAAATSASVPRFVHVSSLAAREPQLSSYGWSKHEAEALVQASSLDWSIVRPPGIYGPGDHDQLDLFRIARRGFLPMPPAGRLSVIHVDDLAALLLALAGETGDHSVYEVEGPDSPLSYPDWARAIGAAVGGRARPIAMPPRLLALAARADRLLRGDKARLTADRVAYFLHPDWAADPACGVPPAIWTPAIPLADGLAATARWYRAAGLL